MLFRSGFVKEGVGAGAACIAASLGQNWQQNQLLAAIEAEMEQLSNKLRNPLSK